MHVLNATKCCSSGEMLAFFHDLGDPKQRVDSIKSQIVDINESRKSIAILSPHNSSNNSNKGGRPCRKSRWMTFR